jgi:hypothetical protein
MPKLIGAAALRVFVCVVLFLCATGVQAEGVSSKGNQPVRNPRLEKIATGLAEALEIRKRVQVAIVPENDRIISVEPFVSGEGYRVEIEGAFLNQLSDDEVIAALAHEMGHVWIDSHQPYVQSETLANEVALRVVPRKPMETLYTKLWAYLGINGNLEETLGSGTSPRS